MALHSPSGHLQRFASAHNAFTHPSSGGNGSQTQSPPRTGTPAASVNGQINGMYAVQSLESPSSTTPNTSSTGTNGLSTASQSNTNATQTPSTQQLLSAALQVAAVNVGSLIHHGGTGQRRPQPPPLSLDSFYSQHFVNTAPSLSDHHVKSKSV